MQSWPGGQLLSWDEELGGGAGRRSWDEELGGGAGTRSWDEELGGGAGRRSRDEELGGGAGTRSWDEASPVFVNIMTAHEATLWKRARASVRLGCAVHVVDLIGSGSERPRRERARGLCGRSPRSTQR